MVDCEGFRTPDDRQRTQTVEEGSLMAQALVETTSATIGKLISGADLRPAESAGGAPANVLMDTPTGAPVPKGAVRWDSRTFTMRSTAHPSWMLALRSQQTNALVVRSIRLAGWVKDIVPVARRIQSLPTGWDGRGSPPPSANLMTQVLLSLQFAEIETLPAPNVVPVPGGGVQLEWCLAERELEVEFKPDGRAEYLETTVASGESSEGSFPASDFHRLRDLLGWLDSGR